MKIKTLRTFLAILFCFLFFPIFANNNDNNLIIPNGTGTVNIRSGPGTQYKVLFQLKDGDTFKKISSQKEKVKIGKWEGFWTEIEFSGKRGWILSTFFISIDSYEDFKRFKSILIKKKFSVKHVSKKESVDDKNPGFLIEFFNNDTFKGGCNDESFVFGNFSGTYTILDNESVQLDGTFTTYDMMSEQMGGKSNNITRPIHLKVIFKQNNNEYHIDSVIEEQNSSACGQTIKNGFWELK